MGEKQDRQPLCREGRAAGQGWAGGHPWVGGATRLLSGQVVVSVGLGGGLEVMQTTWDRPELPAILGTMRVGATLFRGEPGLVHLWQHLATGCHTEWVMHQVQAGCVSREMTRAELGEGVAPASDGAQGCLGCGLGPGK